MQHFVDREQELQTLQAEYDRPGSALVVLYGRRRVGKTTLISGMVKISTFITKFSYITKNEKAMCKSF